jgi:hypothetical protein
MMTQRTLILAIPAILATLTVASADTVTLRNGQKLNGTFLSGSPTQVQFQTNDGKKLTIQIGDIMGMTFTAPPPPPPPPRPAGRVVTVPAGTLLNVRIIDGINVDLSQPGQLYRASIDDPLMMNGNVVIPRGADVMLQAAAVEQSGRFKGSDAISLKINTITVNGKKFDIVTEPVTQKGGSEGKKTARRVIGVAGLGAAIGGIAGGGTGAAIGAVSGAAVGTAASAGKQTLKIPAETRFQFRVASDFKIQ